MVEACGLRKRYGATLAVDDLSFTVPPGQVTGFLGRNGAGKSTPMRLILGLDAPASGAVTVGGRPYAAYRRPLFEAGAMLENKAFHGGRSGRNHLLCLALSNGIGRDRVDEVLDLVGLRSAARKRAGGFSLGMGQRLGIPAPLLGDPPVPILDAPGHERRSGARAPDGRRRPPPPPPPPRRSRPPPRRPSQPPPPPPPRPPPPPPPPPPAPPRRPSGCWLMASPPQAPPVKPPPIQR